jgi:hypothetical protein
MVNHSDSSHDGRLAPYGQASARGEAHEEQQRPMPAAALAESRLLLFDNIHRHELRAAAGEIAAAIAHAMGTPLNVISGRAELIRQDPAKAMAQAERIEEQVRNMASGLRQLVDYLAPPETNVLAAPAEVVVEDVLALLGELARGHGVELVRSPGEAVAAPVPRWHALSTLTTLTSVALQCARNVQGKSEGAKSDGVQRVSVGVSMAPSFIVFELNAPGLEATEGWQIDKFSARPLPTKVSDDYRLLAVCSATVRGNGGKLALEPTANGMSIRFSCKPAT